MERLKKKFLKSATSEQAVRAKVKVRAAGTHVGVLGHGVKLEEQRALDDLTHLTQRKTYMMSVICFFNITKK